ncbi:IS701 family transposase [Verrucosispora sp. WMMC514]|uniref:IS701 family transposase n=1 Tax=Verrucosispora sp. WMMC514 TaxID=3015156 RepID=UPI00248BF78D|nr:IS701 family transposase [Verrucosispora sp. WMMC514]WBB88732.1 IS701 family transposase [Verrucosispora sp. WMMC514]WBB88835.1 IS701 family transposase [Verrucosispora sp. WMMC514]WBB89420.1 IS701 family transposase [Verrucosispora sp. WMMC514]WBB91209.1 IS701 family transposase [Verrucosispora sp. WMMC514]WBB91395.1 IS701 family transposase [Verrucosispora sp. WMMC514]
MAGVLGCFAGRFGRVEPRRAAGEFVSGLLSDLEVKTCWQLAEQAGHVRPDAMQRLLYRAVWDADAVRDDLRALVAGRFGDPDAVLVPDETGDLKKGSHTVGVQRQYTGTAGRIENSQVGVFLAYASRHGHTLIDRRVYLPVSWTDDRDRCAAAGVPDEVGFATRCELAADMITAALDAGVPAGWAAADEAYGNSSVFRALLRERGLGYVLAVSRSHLVPLDGGKTRVRADRVAADLPATAWQRRSAGAGSKGPRFYDWAWLDDVCTDADPDDGGRHSLLIRKNTTTGELAFYRCWTPKPATLAQLVRVAGIRWTVEESFQAAKGQVGLDQHQVRRWDSWHRFTTLALAALAVLAICAADAATDASTDHGLIKLTVNEIRRLINACIIRPITDLAHRLHWSGWRRRHQARARRAHYTRRLNLELQP